MVLDLIEELSINDVTLHKTLNPAFDLSSFMDDPLTDDLKTF
jgi:hypothetical protein